MNLLKNVSHISKADISEPLKKNSKCVMILQFNGGRISTLTVWACTVPLV